MTRDEMIAVLEEIASAEDGSGPLKPEEARVIALELKRPLLTPDSYREACVKVLDGNPLLQMLLGENGVNHIFGRLAYELGLRDPARE